MMKEEFAYTDQVLFDIPLQDRLETPQKAQKNWLRLALRYYTNTKIRKAEPEHNHGIFPRNSNTLRLTQTRQVLSTTPVIISFPPKPTDATIRSGMRISS
jgi:hypothetical protein